MGAREFVEKKWADEIASGEAELSVKDECVELRMTQRMNVVSLMFGALLMNGIEKVLEDTANAAGVQYLGNTMADGYLVFRFADQGESCPND